jgi:hypothetical protein
MENSSRKKSLLMIYKALKRWSKRSQKVLKEPGGNIAKAREGFRQV